MKYPASESFLRIGITGGIGTGKSTVCRLFEQLGRMVISADEIARNITKENRSVLAEIRSSFGEEVFQQDGYLDRKKLAGLVFSDSRRLQVLNTIVHPIVFEEIEKRLSRLTQEKTGPYILIEAALIYETGMEGDLDYVLVVSSEGEKCIARVMQRDDLSKEEVELRIRSQMSMSQKVEMADFVIDNNATPEELVPKVKFLDTLFSTMTKPKRT